MVFSKKMPVLLKKVLMFFTAAVIRFLSHSFPVPFSLSRLICAPARPRVNIIMCVHSPSSGVRLKNMSYNISLYQPVTSLFQKSSGKTVRYVWLLS